MSSSELPVQQDPEGNKSILYIILAFSSVLLAVTAFFSNLALLVTLYQDPHRNLWTAATSLVVNLSVCDLFAGTIGGLISAAVDITIYNGSAAGLTAAFLIAIILGTTSNVVESCTIVAMSFDRWFAVSSPLRYRTTLTPTKMKLLIALIWLYAFLFGSLSSMGVPLDVFTLLYCHLHVSLPILILTLVYWRTYRALRSQSSEIRNLSQGNDAMNAVHTNRERKMTTAFLLVLIFFYAAFIPHFIALNVVAICPSCTAHPTMRSFHSLSSKVPFIHYCVNPFIYAWRIPKYKKAFQTVLRRCCRRNQQNQVHPTPDVLSAARNNAVIAASARP